MSISNKSPDSKFKLVVFPGVSTASEFQLATDARPLALILKLTSGRMLELDFGLKERGGVVTQAVRDLVPLSGSAMVLTDDELKAVDDRLRFWKHVVQSL